MIRLKLKMKVFTLYVHLDLFLTKPIDVVHRGKITLCHCSNPYVATYLQYILCQESVLISV